MIYPWYETLNHSNEIRQGDLILDCPIIIPPTNFNYIETQDAQIPNAGEVVVRTMNSVVVTQSCDLENDKVENVLVCPYYTWSQFVAAMPTSDQTANGRKRKWDELRKGNLPSYHLINKDEDVGLEDYLVVDFRNVFGVNYPFLRTFAENIPTRQRLLPPYREHLSQSFARFFMRVGLPIDIELQ